MLERAGRRPWPAPFQSERRDVVPRSIDFERNQLSRRRFADCVRAYCTESRVGAHACPCAYDSQDRAYGTFSPMTSGPYAAVSYALYLALRLNHSGSPSRSAFNGGARTLRRTRRWRMNEAVRHGGRTRRESRRCSIENEIDIASRCPFDGRDSSDEDRKVVERMATDAFLVAKGLRADEPIVGGRRMPRRTAGGAAT